jgi:hypothetical protein
MEHNIMNIIATYTTASNYSVKVEGDVIYGMVTEDSQLWKELGIDSLVVRPHDWDFIPKPDPTNQELSKTEQSKMRTELEWCDLMLKYIASGDTARSGGLTKGNIYTYAIACRDHVISTDGVLSIVGDIPERPNA